MNKKSLYILMAGATILNACSNDDFSDGTLTTADTKGRVAFTVNEDDLAGTQSTRAAGDMEPVKLTGDLGKTLWLCPSTANGIVSKTGEGTRGTLVTSADGLTSFGVSAFKTDAGVTDLSQATPDFFYNLAAERTGTSGSYLYSIGQDYYWPANGEQLTFFAYAPNDNSIINDAEQLVLSKKSDEGAQTIQFTVNQAIPSQIDLMTAKATSQSHLTQATPAVTLPFKHELTAIRVILGEQFPEGTIKSIALKGVYGQGRLTIGADNDPESADHSTWQFIDKDGASLEPTYNFTYTIDKTDVQGDNLETLMPDGEHFLMIPQTLGRDAKLEIIYQDNRKDYTVTASLEGQEWKAGQTVTYAISSTKLTTLKLGSVTWPENTPTAAPKLNWANNDAIGLYAVGKRDGYGNVDYSTLVYKNVKCTYENGSWIIDNASEDVPVYFFKDYEYFFYYPYTENPTTDLGYPANGQGKANATANEFFSALIDRWGKNTSNVELDTYKDQSLEQNFLAMDLQTAKGTKDNDYVSTLNVTMEHKMGLAQLNLKTKEVPEVQPYYLSTDANYTWRDSVQLVTLAPSVTYTSEHKPYTSSVKSNVLLYWVRPSVTTAFSTDGLDNWTRSVSINGGNIGEVDVQSSRTETVLAAKSHTLAVGNVFFNDGAIAAKVNSIGTANKKKAIGLVYKLGTAEGERATASQNHGMVIALRNNTKNSSGNAASSISGYNAAYQNYLGTDDWGYKWGANTTTATGNAYLPMAKNSAYSTISADLNGYTKTKRIKDNFTADQFPAPFAAINFATEMGYDTPAASTGWYMPAAGQINQWLRAFSSTMSGTTPVEWYDTNNVPYGAYYPSIADKIAMQVNSSGSVTQVGQVNTPFSTAGFTNSVGAASGTANLYDPIIWSSSVYYIFWSVSEYSVGYPFHVNFPTDTSLTFYRYSDRSRAFRVRPVLAF